MLLARRSLLLAASLAAAPVPSWARALSRGVFTHGVASGDPLPDGVIIWTRFATAEAGNIGWEIADDENFTRIVQRGETRASFANDFCVKADVRGLQPGRPYFYRFVSASGPSPTGRTRTAPSGGVESLSIAFFSCSNFSVGYFHAYGHAARRDDIDIAMHLGDYIYEYSNPNDAVPGRKAEPLTETIRLADYYQRYALAHTDPALLELRRLKPMSVVWDDHEIANNTWQGGAGNHQPATEGAWTDRVAAASKAYFDWMPIRRPDPRGPRVYRSFDWGDLARIVMLDTRYIGRSQQLEYRDFFTALDAPGADGPALAREFRRTLDDPNRTMMGAAQERWFADTLAQSKRNGQPWQVIAQQIVVGEQTAPPSLARMLRPDASLNNKQFFDSRIGALGLPWNLDNWNGYPAARTRFLSSMAANANNAVVLGGDSHNCWVYDLPAPEANRRAAIEFAGGSVTSTGFERSLVNAQPGEREREIRAANPTLAWCDITYRGDGAVKLTRQACEAEWIAFDNVRSPEATPTTTRFSAEPSATAGPGAWAVAS